MLSFFPGRFTRLTPLTTFKELLEEGDLSDIWSSGFTDSKQHSLLHSNTREILEAAVLWCSVFSHRLVWSLESLVDAVCVCV